MLLAAYVDGSLYHMKAKAMRPDGQLFVGTGYGKDRPIFCRATFDIVDGFAFLSNRMHSNFPSLSLPAPSDRLCFFYYVRFLHSVLRFLGSRTPGFFVVSFPSPSSQSIRDYNFVSVVGYSLNRRSLHPRIPNISPRYVFHERLNLARS